MNEFEAQQEDELIALRCIYGDDFKDLRPPKLPSKKSMPREKETPLFSITLRLNCRSGNLQEGGYYDSEYDFMHDMEVQEKPTTTVEHAITSLDTGNNPSTSGKQSQLTLRFQLPPKYPIDKPEIRIENVVGIAADKLSQLRRVLEQVMEEKVGQVMVHDLASAAEVFLIDAQAFGQGRFLMDERARTREIRLKQMRIEKEDILDKIRRTRESSQGSGGGGGEVNAPSDTKFIIMSDHSSSHTCHIPEHHSPQVLEFPSETLVDTANCTVSLSICRGECFLHEEVTPLPFSASSTPFLFRSWFSGMSLNNGKPVLLCHYSFVCPEKRVATVEASLAEMRVQLRTLSRALRLEDGLGLPGRAHILPCIALLHSFIREHPGLVTCSVVAVYPWEQGAMLFQQSTVMKVARNVGPHLGEMRVESLHLSKLKEACRQLLLALDFLKTNHLAHGFILAHNIVVYPSHTYKLMGCNVEQCIVSLLSLDTVHDFSHLRICEERLSSPLSRDIYCLGLTVLELHTNSRYRRALSSDAINSITDKELRDFLQRCLLESSETSLHSLKMHDFLALSKNAAGGHSAVVATGADRELAEDRNKRGKSLLDVDLEYAKAVSQHQRASSHLQEQFVVLETLGRGGFGDVLRAKNKLDGNEYAIKRINLTGKSTKTIAKVCSEARLLSNLRHENIVRYYGAWTEKHHLPKDKTSSSSSEESKSDAPQGLAPRMRLGQLNFTGKENEDSLPSLPGMRTRCSVDDLIVFGGDTRPSNGSGQLTQCFDSVLTAFDHVASSDESNSEDGSSDGSNADSEDSDDERSDDEGEWAIRSSRHKDHMQLYLLIQMEYCEKHTLLNVIQSGKLHQDRERLWRLFREILSGLAHIHEQGIYHRDLKPANIFLDSHDHAKIGDFGLAMLRQSGAVGAVRSGHSVTERGSGDIPTLQTPKVHCPLTLSTHEGDTEEDMTPVGTRLYAAPEVLQLVSVNARRRRKAAKGGTEVPVYTDKVDMYSLGVIFFEMCYRPMRTYMEESTTIATLCAQLTFPEDFPEEERSLKEKIVYKLLDKVPHYRYSAKELLLSDLLPTTNVWEAQFQEQVQKAVRHPESTTYHLLMDRLFSRYADKSDDFLYDVDQVGLMRTQEGLRHTHLLGTEFCEGTNWRLRRCVVVRDLLHRLESIFSRHGAVPFNPPLLLPRRDDVTATRGRPVQLIDHSGFPLMLPNNLRLPFARFAVKDGMKRVKRYQIAPVFQRCQKNNAHPTCVTEIAFDVIYPEPCFFAHAEVFVVLQDILKELPMLKGGRYVLRVNHRDIIRAVLYFVGIPETKHTAFCNILSEFRIDSTGSIIAPEEFHKLDMSFALLTSIQEYTSAEGSVDEVCRVLEPIQRAGGLASQLVQRGVTEIRQALWHFQQYFHDGDDLVSISFTLSLTRQLHLYSGLIFQLVSVKPGTKCKLEDDEQEQQQQQTSTTTKVTQATENGPSEDVPPNVNSDNITTATNQQSSSADSGNVQMSSKPNQLPTSENVSSPWSSRRYRAMDIIAFGGRYDDQNVSSVRVTDGEGVLEDGSLKPPFALGFSLCLETLLQHCQHNRLALDEAIFGTHVKVAVSGSNKATCRKPILEVLKLLWTVKMPCDVIIHTENMEALVQHCAHMGIPYLVYVKEEQSAPSYTLRNIRLSLPQAASTISPMTKGKVEASFTVETEGKFPKANDLVDHLLRRWNSTSRDPVASIQRGGELRNSVAGKKELQQPPSSQTRESASLPTTIQSSQLVLAQSQTQQTRSRDIFLIVMVPKDRKQERKHVEETVNQHLSPLRQALLSQLNVDTVSVLVSEVSEGFVDALVKAIRPNMDPKTFKETMDEMKKLVKPREVALNIAAEMREAVNVRRQRMLIVYSRPSNHYGILFLPMKL